MYRINTLIVLMCLCFLSGCGSKSQLPNQTETSESEAREEHLHPEESNPELMDEGSYDMDYDDIELEVDEAVELEDTQEDATIPVTEFSFISTEWTMIHDSFDNVKTSTHIGRKLGSFVDEGYSCNVDLAFVIDSGHILDGIVLCYEDQETFTVKVMNIADVSQAVSECYIIGAVFREGEYAGEMCPGQYVLGEPVKNQIRQQFGVPNESGEDYYIYDAITNEKFMFFWFSDLKQRYQLSDTITCRLEFDQQTLKEIRFEDSKLSYRVEKSEDDQFNQYEDMTPSVMEVLEPLE